MNRKLERIYKERLTDIYLLTFGGVMEGGRRNLGTAIYFKFLLLIIFNMVVQYMETFWN